MPTACATTVVYEPSAFEVSWVAFVQAHVDRSQSWQRGCDKLRNDSHIVDAWLNWTTTDFAAGRGRGTWPDVGRPPVSTVDASSIFSSHRIANSCDAPDATPKRVPIEPLASFLRSPRHLCFKRASHKYFKEYIVPSRPPAFIPVPRRSMFFDIGASLYAEGLGGASQDWFVSTYAARGIIFERIFAWEAQGIPPAKLFGPPLPVNVMDSLSYYNVPVVALRGGRHNPWRTLRSVATVDDFVVVKLDVDTISVESDLVEQLLEQTQEAGELRALIDEFYYEHHVIGSPMAHSWQPTFDVFLRERPELKEAAGWRRRRDRKGNEQLATLNDSYAMFTRLRQAGIRAHSWV